MGRPWNRTTPSALARGGQVNLCIISVVCHAVCSIDLLISSIAICKTSESRLGSRRRCACLLLAQIVYCRCEDFHYSLRLNDGRLY
jgi:hypothetical protein